jgi:hypothetical protein
MAPQNLHLGRESNICVSDDPAGFPDTTEGNLALWVPIHEMHTRNPAIAITLPTNCNIAPATKADPNKGSRISLKLGKPTPRTDVSE